MDLNRVLKKEKNSLICNVDNMVVYISRHFEKYMMLNVSDNVSALAISEITVGKESTGFFLPAVVTMSPSSVKFENVNGDEFVRCEHIMFMEGKKEGRNERWEKEVAYCFKMRNRQTKQLQKAVFKYSGVCYRLVQLKSPCAVACAYIHQLSYYG